MAISQAMCTSFKEELFEAVHDFDPSTGDTFKVALYTSSASLGAATTAYSATNEVTGTGYTAGGVTVNVASVSSSGTTGFVDFSDATFPSVTVTARGAVIYNSSKSNRAIAVLDFGEDKTVSGGNFVIVMPTADAANAILRIA